MKKLNNLKVLSVLLIGTLLFSFCGGMLYADNAVENIRNTVDKAESTKSLVESGVKIVGDIFKKVFGLDPIVHAFIIGGASAINTGLKLSKVKMDYTLEKDFVNISADHDDFFIPKDDFLTHENNILTSKNILVTDKNVLDVKFIETKNLNEISTTSTPLFRLAEKTKLILTLDSNNQPKYIQKREILFEDTENTVKNDYEYRSFVIKYPKITFPKFVNFELTGKDVISWNFLLPFYTGASSIKLNKYLTGENKSLINKINSSKKNESMVETFKLIFNSYQRDILPGQIDSDLINCVDGTRMLGNTGKEALPKIAFDWTFSSGKAKAIYNEDNEGIDRKTWCDGDQTGGTSKNYIYCDATQFSIEILLKLNEILDFVKNKSSGFTCPYPGTTKTLITKNNNIGFTFISAAYDDLENTVNVDYTIEGSLDLPEGFTGKIADLNISVYADSVFKKYVTKEISSSDLEVLGSDTLSIPNISVDDEDIPLKVIAIINFVEDIKDLDNYTEDNIIEHKFKINGTICNTPKTSANINLYSKDKLDTDLFDFRSYLIKDGFSNDFKSDFDKYYRFTLMSAPTDYTETFYKAFISDNFNFVSNFGSEPGKLLLQGPGRYHVFLDITFDDEWKVFNSKGEFTGKINVVLERELPPSTKEDSPFYYLPFNGLVGIDTENARQGYGVDFTGDVIPIAKIQNPNISLMTEPFTQSNTVNTLRVQEYGKDPVDFSFLNNGETRGMLLSLTLSGQKTNPTLNFIPSRATPVNLKVDNNLNHAYAFYKIDIGGPQNKGGSPAKVAGGLLPWTGQGNCLDFSGIPINEVFNYRLDLPATSSILAPTTPSENVTYGVEWESKNIIRKGNVFLNTVVYTPSNFKTGDALSVLYLDSYDDDALFFTKAGSGKNVDLKNIFDEDVKYVSEIFDLVVDKKACISYSGNELRVFYNPAKVYELFYGVNQDSLTDTVENWISSNGTCIKE